MLKAVLSFFIFFSYPVFSSAIPTKSSYTPRSSIKSVKKNSISKSRSKWSLVVPSFVIHGLRPTGEASDVMPRKIDKAGNTVVTPGLGMKYEGPDGELFVTGMVKDCYDNLAGTLQYGYYSNLSKNSRWGFTFGFYFRETPLYCEVTDFGNFKTTECFSMDNYPMKIQTTVNGFLVDIIPMPFFHYSTSIYKSADLQINFKMMSNIILNEFAIAVPF